MMAIDVDSFFKQYENIVQAADQAFEQVRAAHPEAVRCEIKCADCCHALFDLTLVEAMYINRRYQEGFTPEQKEALIEKANRADRATYKVKRLAQKALEAGTPEAEILSEVAAQRIRCPLLNEQERCSLYAYRPITCRLYGIPTAIAGEAHTCGRSDFLPGKPYPTVNLDAINNRLYGLSSDLIAAIGSRHINMADMLVPLSMALLTVYDEEYLGVSGETERKPEERSTDEQ